MNSRHFGWLFILSLIAGTLKAQQFGGNPASLKWKQINTDTARIIFPEGLEDAGARVASIVHKLQRENSTSIGSKTRKVNIVLQNQNTVSNAYVALAPYRSEFYLFAPQNSFQLGAINWIDNLSLHEYRHVQQYNNFNVGLSKVAGIVLGQQGQAFANAAAVPDWFFEGDAVFNETLLSRQGRGRIPAFFNGYQSLYRQNRQYSYMKLRNGSFRHYVPDHYNLGYLLVAYGRQRFGEDFWKKVSADAAAFKHLIYPWQSSFKKHAGFSYNQFVKEAFASYQAAWHKAEDTRLIYITPVKTGAVTDYKYAYPAEDGSAIVLKRSYRRIPAFYRIDRTGAENRLGTRDISNDDYFSYRNSRIIFTSYQADKRWGYREYSNIRIKDLKTGQSTTLTQRERYFSPDISLDGQKVTAVEMRTNQMCNLVVMNLKGESLYRSKAARGTIYTYPKFSSNDSFIYSPVRQADGQMSILKIDLSSGKESPVFPFGNRLIGLPVVQGDTLFFTSSYKGSDELWAYVEKSKIVYRIAVNATGLYQGFYDQFTGHLITSNFTADGYRLAAINRSQQLWEPVNLNEEALPDLYVPGALQQNNRNLLNGVPVANFPVTKYRKSFNLLNFHSWRPYYDDPEFTVSLLGENILNTLQTEISYTYNRNEGSHRAHIDAVYGGWFVQPLFGVSETFNRRVRYNSDTTFYYNEFNANAGLKLPLNFSSGRSYRFLTLTSTVNNQQVKWTGIGKRLLRNVGFNYYQAQIQYSSQVQKAAQQIYPHFAYSLLGQYRTIINKYSAKQFLASASLYVPGMLPTHSVVFTAAYQQRDTAGQYVFSSSFPFSKGYNAVDFPRMVKLGANYHLPLLYPDWGLANIVYFKRVRGSTFFDYTRVKSLRTGNTFYYNSAGAEVYFDTRWWNQEEVTFGIRYSRLLNYERLRIRQPNQWEVILPVGLFR